ncbi:MAG: hypothetical protein OXE44_04270 [Nitrospinae bacterium]|nr:hypothetical protein [Nitrospinota bacterium]
MNQPSKQEIQGFMSKPQNLRLMRTATHAGRPAVEPLANGLLNEFDLFFRTCSNKEKNSTKRMIGRVARELMERMGYEVAQRWVLTTGNPLFTKATQYKKS